MAADTLTTELRELRTRLEELEARTAVAEPAPRSASSINYERVLRRQNLKRWQTGHPKTVNIDRLDPSVQEVVRALVTADKAAQLKRLEGGTS
jgi:hypothetical protein